MDDISSVCENRLITFVFRAKNMDKLDEPDAEMSEYIKLYFLMDPENLASNYFQQFAIFKDGCPEEWIKWVRT
jgi:hypothetical protein